MSVPVKTSSSRYQNSTMRESPTRRDPRDEARLLRPLARGGPSAMQLPATSTESARSIKPLKMQIVPFTWFVSM
eukprot:3647368-Prymnesium_polylepis.3